MDSSHSRAAIHEAKTRGERAADAVAGGIGSWRFVIAQGGVTLLWLTANSLHGWSHWDKYPFVLLNLVYSFQAGFTGPILLLAGNRQAQKDRLRDDHEAVEVHLLYRINRQQLLLLALWPAMALGLGLTLARGMARARRRALRGSASSRH